MSVTSVTEIVSVIARFRFVRNAVDRTFVCPCGRSRHRLHHLARALGIDGFETCRRLKRDAGLTNVPVIFMTGLAETEHIVRGLEAGGVDYVTKPIVIEVMLARIRVHLANARMTQSAQTALDVSGRFLMAVNGQGRILWATPQAQKLLSDNLPAGDGDEVVLPLPMLQWLDQAQKGKAGVEGLG